MFLAVIIIAGGIALVAGLIAGILLPANKTPDER